MALIRRGEVWVARLNPNQGAEVGKVRPVVVIQPAALTDAGLATLVVVPLTSQRRRGADALRVPIPARDRLLRECWAMAEQPRALDRNHLRPEGTKNSRPLCGITTLLVGRASL